MIRKLAIISFVFVFPLISFSQHGKAYIGMTTGISIPFGDFASKEYQEGGFALPGWKVNMEGVFYVYQNLGVGLQAGYFAHPVDVEALASERLKHDSFLEQLSIRSDPYRAVSLAAFAQYSLALCEKCTLEPKLGGGVLYGRSPYQLYKSVYYLIGKDWREVTSTWDYSGFVTAGGAFRYRLSLCIDFLAKAELGYGTLKYQFLTGTGDIREDVHHFWVADLTAGISIRF